MIRPLVARSLGAVLVVGGGCGGRDEAQGKAAPAKAPPPPAPRPGGGDATAAPPPGVRPAPPTYSDSVQGLESLIRSLVSAIQNDDTNEEARLLESMRLQDPKAWFGQAFEPPMADRLVAEYEPLGGGIGHLVNALKGPI